MFDNHNNKKLDNVCKTYICPHLTKVNEAENIGHSDPISISICSTPQAVFFIKFDECRTCTSREKELNAKSNQSQ